MRTVARRKTVFVVVVLSMFLWCSGSGAIGLVPQASAAGGGSSEGSLSAAPSSAGQFIPRASDAARKETISAANLQNHFRNRIEIKFREGSGIRSRNGSLTVVADKVRGEAPYGELNQVQAILGKLNGYQFTRMHALTEGKLEAMKNEGEQAARRELPDLNLWYYLYVDVDSLQALADVINQLNALDIVEFAYASDLPAPPPGMDEAESSAWVDYWKGNDLVPWPTAEEIKELETGMDPPPLTPPTEKSAVPAPDVTLTIEPPPLPGNYVSFQDYREAAPIGIDVDYIAGRYWAHHGWSAAYTDCEYWWRQSHADLTDIASATVLCNGTPHADAATFAGDHGTAVVGEISSDDNAFGTKGLAHYSSVKLSTEWPTTGYNRTAAITSAAAQFWKGAVILLEMQTTCGFDCNGTDTRDPYIPTEYRAADKAAITTATANGRIVVEAGGNGNCNLDLAAFGGLFNPSDASKDSGAIIVGAGEKLTRNKASFSTYGSRVDCQSEGDWQIYTTGYGDFYNTDGANYFYTDSFSGTSGASPIVTGAALNLAGLLKSYHGSYYAPKEIRDLFRRDGTPQGTGGHIGRRPDLKKQIVHMHNRHMQMHSADFNGNGKSDYAVFRPSNGTWYIRYDTGATAAIAFGAQNDIPCPADVNGDGRAELVVFRQSTGTWYIRYWTGATASYVWGRVGDIPVPLDYNGDGRAELVVWRWTASPAKFYIRYWTGASAAISWGAPGDTPLSADINKDGKDDLIVFRKGKWYVYYSGGGSTSYTYGAEGDVPLIYRDSGGTPHYAVWRPSNGRFYESGGGSFAYGVAGDIPRYVDTNGNNWDEALVYRPSNGRWYNHGTGTSVAWGAVGDFAVSK